MDTLLLRPKPDRRAPLRIPPRDLARMTPENGDIVVRAEQREGTPIHVLHKVIVVALARHLEDRGSQWPRSLV
jgi:hypothetical protein